MTTAILILLKSAKRGTFIDVLIATKTALSKVTYSNTKITLQMVLLSAPLVWGGDQNSTMYVTIQYFMGQLIFFLAQQIINNTQTQ